MVYASELFPAPESRRAFLQRLAASAAAMALDPFRGVIVSDDVYRNERLRLALRRPRGWEFSSIADFAALRERQVLQGLLDDEEPHPLKDPHNLPVFLFEAAAFRDGYFAPCIGLYDEALPGAVPSDEARAHQDVMLEGFAAAYRGMRVEVEPQLLQLRGTSASLSRWSYCHDLEGDGEFHLSVRTLLVFRAPRVHTYHLVDAVEKPRIHEAVWHEFLASIRYLPEGRA